MKYLAALVSLATVIAIPAQAVAVWGQCKLYTISRVVFETDSPSRRWYRFQRIHNVRCRHQLCVPQRLLLSMPAWRCRPTGYHRGAPTATGPAVLDVWRSCTRCYRP